MSSPLLEVRGLFKRFPVKRAARTANTLRRLVSRGSAPTESWLHAVDGVDFSIAVGETVGLVGESGCGKSTLVRLVTRLLDPGGGSILFAGRDIGAVAARRFGRTPERAALQMVFQDAGESLNPRYTAARAIADPLLRLQGFGGKALAARVREVAALAGLPGELLGRFPHQLSGGQKARVGIARAIAVEPRLLILDEPTAALDVSVQVVILQLLEELKRRLGMSYLFVSHDLNVVRLICDRVLVMYLGRIVESGPAAQVFARPGHPYTRALIDSIPGLERRGEKRLRLAGEPLSPIDPDPNVCRFYGRCPQGVELCARVAPPTLSLGGGQTAACHFAGQVAATAPAAAVSG
jgi:oligopeptide/dipeptide ABC transporter ATP-binding protein